MHITYMYIKSTYTHAIDFQTYIYMYILYLYVYIIL